MNVVGYVRVSTAEQADSGAGLEAQRAAIKAEATRRSWQLLTVYEDAGVRPKVRSDLLRTGEVRRPSRRRSSLDAAQVDAIAR